MNEILCGVCGEEIPPDQVEYFQGNPFCPKHKNRIEFYQENQLVQEITHLPAKIPINLQVVVRLASAAFDGVRRSYATDYEGAYPIPDNVEVREIRHGYVVEDFLIEVPQKLMDMLTEDCFLEIKVEGKTDHITDDATEEIREIAWLS